MNSRNVESPIRILIYNQLNYYWNIMISRKLLGRLQIRTEWSILIARESVTSDNVQMRKA